MKKTVGLILLIASACLAQGKQPPKIKYDPHKFSDQAVQGAIEKGVKFLLSRQKDDGGWEPYFAPPRPGQTPGFRGDDNTIGPSCMVLYALLEKGMSVKDANIAKGVDFITKNTGKDSDTDRNYSIAMRCQALLAAFKQDKKYLKFLEADVQQLIKSMYPDGSYSYYTPDNKKSYEAWKAKGDNSNSQYGVLGVWAGAKAGIEIPKEYWNLVMKYWLGQQRTDNGWCYRTSDGYYPGQDDVTTAAMTTAGIATLFVCLDAVMADKFIRCDTAGEYAPIKRGLEWIDKNFEKTLTDEKIRGKSGIPDFYYYLYGVERIGLASGYKFFGRLDWYKFGTKWLLENQKADGSWTSKYHNLTPDIATSYALLFLIRGQRPVLLNRLQYEGDWNNRPRAMANFVRWGEKAFETECNWQIITFTASVDEWHDSAILCITGSKAPKFSDDDLAALRTFVYQGGTILGITECNGLAFTKGMQDAYRKMFPKYELALCGPEHPINTVQYKLPAGIQFSEVHNGIRPLAIHTDRDLPLAWQTYQVATGKPNFDAAANIILYVTDRQFRNRGTEIWPAEPTASAAKTVSVARLRYPGNYDPEPLALEKFARHMAQKYPIRVELAGVKKTPAPASAPAGASQPSPEIEKTGIAAAELKPGTTLAIMSGTGRFTLPAADKDALKKYADSGGTILLESAGGSGGFFESAQELAGELWGKDKIVQIPADCPLYQIKDMTVEKVRYRRATAKRIGAAKEPRLMGVMRGDRPFVILSREDLSGGLVGYSILGLDGYEPDSAFEIMRNIVILASTAK
ncbi:MAG: DUF4159 domain-containing protein [Planctomycetes bacterium]|nr:DUF4159 domain-containing protein [Planctomycetota bacterium]